MNLVLTIAIGENYQKLAALTHPSIKAYADSMGAEFLAINEQTISKTTPHWEKFQIHDLLDKYDRILYIDTDVIIRDDCPSLFDLVPDGELGMFNEQPFTDRSRELMIDICNKYDTKIDYWDGKYYNSGVMVISQCHKALFKKPDKEVFSFFEQSYLNMRISQDKISIAELQHHYNRMTCMDRVTGEERFASYIIHYAGYPHLEFALDLIPKDLAKWRPPYKYRSHIFVNVSGGLGDQISAEPAIRFMKDYVYPEADIKISTHFPRVFQHLGLPVYKHGEYNSNEDIPYYIANSLPGPESLTWAVVSNMMCHTVDYCSIALLKRTLPNKDKKITLQVTKEDEKELERVAGAPDYSKLVVLHAGRHWESKTIPEHWWQELVNEILLAGIPLCLIGKNDSNRGVHNVVCGEGVLDLRDKLSLGTLFALISKAWMLVSNDSAPVHIAGAFDNYITVLPTCKHPDHVLPFRDNDKSVALYKKLTLDDISQAPTEIYGSSAEFITGKWEDYLTDPKNVVNNILNRGVKCLEVV